MCHHEMVTRRILLAFLPHLILAIWLVLLSWLVHRRVEATDLPPVYDAMGYSQKAEIFWRSVAQHHLVNPFDIPPTIRGPGTILMSYPFGFSRDFHDYYLRSTLFPVFLVVLAVYVASYTATSDIRRSWDLVFFAMLLSTLPAFYHFEIKERDFTGYWGLIDNFLAGIAAVAAAAFLRAIRSPLVIWPLLAAVSSGLALTVKPTGAVVILVVALVTAAKLLIDFFQFNSTGSQNRSKEVVGTICAVLIWTLFGILSFGSSYLSSENIAFGKQAMKVLSHNDLRITISFSSLVLPSIGYIFPFLLLLVVIGVAVNRKIWRSSPVSKRAAWMGSLLITMALVVGGCFWIASGGVTQFRYLLPFVLMGGISLPFLVEFSLIETPPWLRISCWMLCALPAVNLTLLLIQQRPSERWQGLTGVNLSAGVYGPQIRQGAALLQDVRRSGTSATVYSLDVTPDAAVLLSVGAYNYRLEPSQPSFTVRFPVSWQASSTIRIKDMASADYIYFEPVTEPQLSRPVDFTTVSDFYGEVSAMRTLMSMARPDEGIRIVSETSGRLVKVVDKSRLQRYLVDQAQHFRWDPAFLDANQELLTQ